MERLKQLREKMAKLVADARAKFEEIKTDTPEARAKEIEAEYDRMMAEYDTLDAEAQRIEANEARKRKLEEREADLERPDPRRPNGDPPPVDANERKKQEEARRAAFAAYLRFGTEGLTREQRQLLNNDRSFVGETRAQGTQLGTAGGYLVAEGFMIELVKSLKAWGPMMDGTIVRFLQTATGASIPWPTVDDTGNEGSLIAENTQVTTVDVTFGVKTIEAYKYSSNIVLVPNELLQDAAIDVEVLVRDLMAERIGRIGNKHLTTGDGASKPNGVITAAGAGATAASATAIVMDDLINLEHSVDPAYRSDPSCRFMFNDGTLKAIRKLKDGEGRYIWQPADAQAGSPATLLNYPYSINQAVADIATTAKSVAFGAFNRYVHRMVQAFSVRRLIERYADYDQTAFIGFARLDGELLDSGAVKVLTHP